MGLLEKHAGPWALTLKEQAQHGLLPDALRPSEIAELWADELGESATWTEEVSIILYGLVAELTAVETGQGIKTYRLEQDPVLHRDDFRRFLEEEGEKLPAFWFPAEDKPTEMEKFETGKESRSNLENTPTAVNKPADKPTKTKRQRKDRLHVAISTIYDGLRQKNLKKPSAAEIFQVIKENAGTAGYPVIEIEEGGTLVWENRNRKVIETSYKSFENRVSKLKTS